MLGRRRILGLAVTNRSITAVEVVAEDGGGRSSRTGEFLFPGQGGLEEPARLGKALRQFLRREGFSASRCVIGVDASWLTAREKALPPGAGASVGQILSLMIEREYASDRKELAFDYALGPEAGDGQSALLVAAPQRIVAQLTTMAEAAGLRVAGITASVMALLGQGNEPAQADQLVLHLFGGGAELALRSRGALRMMRRLSLTVPTDRRPEQPPTTAWLQQLTDELRCVVALQPGELGQKEPQRQLLVWDETGRDWPQRWELSEQLALPVQVCRRPEGLAVDGAVSPAPGCPFSAAAAMALEAVRGRSPTVDLLHSRLSPRRALGVGRKAVWAAAVVLAIAAAAVVLALDWRSDRLEAAALDAKLQAMAGDLAGASDVIDKVSFARPWYDRRPSYLDCMRELALAFPQEGLVWAKSLAIEEDMRVVVRGNAVSEPAVLDVLDRLKANPKLADVQQLYIQADRQGREVTFAMGFTFLEPNRTWSSPNAKKRSSQQR